MQNFHGEPVPVIISDYDWEKDAAAECGTENNLKSHGCDSDEATSLETTVLFYLIMILKIKTKERVELLKI